MPECVTDWAAGVQEALCRAQVTSTRPMLGGQMSTPRRPTGGNSRVNESSDTSDKPVKPQDYAGLRAELAELVDDFRYR